MMTSRERVERSLQHREPDRIPLDLGGSFVTGMHVSSVYALRQALTLDPPGTPVRVIEPRQMLGEVALDLAGALGVDVVQLRTRRNAFGFANEGWKPWTTFDGTPVLVPEKFNTELGCGGDLLQHPEGDRSAPASGRMPKGGLYFDNIIRQSPIDEDRLDPADNLEEFGPLSDDDLSYFSRTADYLHGQTDKAILASFGGTSFGDIAQVPAAGLRHPHGIRDIEEWYISTIARRDYVYRVFEGQCDIALGNLERIHRVVGDKVTAVMVTGTDFGAQHGAFVSPQTYQDLYMPFHKAINGWIHEHTRWKTFIHSCGAVFRLVPHFIEAGFDILNPVQCSAAEMDPARLKREFGRDLVFWGGGVNTQQTLPFGTAEEVREEVRERLHVFGRGGGFVFSPVHNVQAGVPLANLLALYEAFREHCWHPLG